VRVGLWGTRGSVASAGPETMGYGGNTSCVQVVGDDGTVLVLDAGTAIRRLGASLDADVHRVDLLLTHLHMDHIQGLGFFRPFFRPDFEVHIWGPPSTTQDLRTRLTRYLSPPLFPVRLRDVECHLELHDVPLGSWAIGRLEVTASTVIHPGPTVGYRVADSSGSVAYLPDHEPALGYRPFPGPPEWTSGFTLAEGVDLLIHDAQYTPAEYARRVGWGHSSLPDAVAFARLARVRRFVTFHHDPEHDDACLDRLVEEARHGADGVDLLPGREGSWFDMA
jgi:phosphoribosyl 1,2-cyclic phosphodiesterase